MATFLTPIPAQFSFLHDASFALAVQARNVRF